MAATASVVPALAGAATGSAGGGASVGTGWAGGATGTGSWPADRAGPDGPNGWPDPLGLPGPLAGPYTEPLDTPLAAPLSATVAVTKIEQRTVEEYWTEDRRSRAQAANVVERSEPIPEPAPRPADTDAAADRDPMAAAPPPPSTGSAYVHGGLITRTVGRLFSTIQGVDYACSATVVSSLSRDMVVTAGHCLHSGAGGAFANNISFMPGYHDGQMPHGLWTARRIMTTPTWAGRSDFDHDVGFALFNTRDARHLQDVVGAQRIGFNLPRMMAQYAFGYPRLGAYDGNRLIYCAGSPFPDPYGTASIGLSCTMTGGASGGPLLVGLGRGGPGAGWVDSVVSYAYVGRSDMVYGTYFGRAVEILYYQSNDL